jgi:CRP-like cAMP-binding protein
MVESWYDIEYLPKAELYEQLTAGTTRALTEAGSIIALKPGAKLFSAGDPSDRMHIIRTGIIEVWRRGLDGKYQVVAYLGPGDAIGETVMLTGSRRESEARAPEGAELLQIRREAFVDLCRRTPELMMRLMVVFAHRLEAAYKRETIERRRQLKGSLQHFDLPTVLQTVGRSQGMLSIHKGLGALAAEIEVQAGTIQYARHGHLSGIEAFYQLFQSPAEGEFVFREGFKLPPEDRGPLVGRPIDQALIAAMSLVDEMRGLIDRFPDTDRIYLPRYDELQWVEADSTVAANDLWACLHRGQTFSKALETLPYCHARLFKILARLVNTEQVAPAD